MEGFRQFIAIVSLFVLFLTASISRAFAGERPPNVIFIFADDLGYNDLGCYGSPLIRTPNLDGMAAEGVRFTDFYSCACVCTPSRAGLMTGRYPTRSGLQNGVLSSTASNGIPAWEITLGEALSDLGYATACIGKWHLGHRTQYLPTNNGFDYYYGIPYSNDMTPTILMENETTIEDPVDQTTLTKRYTQKALEFIDTSHAAGTPFFLYFPHTFPHVPLYASTDFLGTSPRGLYGDVVEELDWSVGEIRSKLEALGIDGETLVIFTSDNGPWLIKGADGGSADPLRDGKGTVYDGGVREACIAWWPGHIPAGREETRPAIMVDWFPTLLGLCGGSLPADRVYDGRDISGLLFDTGDRADYEFFFNTGFQGMRAHRSGDWKLWAEGSPALYNLADDISETTNLSSTQAGVFDRLQWNLAWFANCLAAEGTPGDVDGDGIPDSWETAHGLDPRYPMDAIADGDGDGYTGYQEYLGNSDPLDADSLPGPVNLQATPADWDQIELRWEESQVPGIVSYNVYRSTFYGFTPSAGTLVATGVATLEYRDLGLARQTTYFYVVTAVDGAGRETAPSRVASATTDVEPPEAPTGLLASPLAPGAVGLDWDVGPESDLAGYNVYRDTTPGFTPSAANLAAARVPGSAYVDAGLAHSTTYHYVVTAVDTNGNESAASSAASATTASDAGGPAGHWQLDEMKGTAAFDSSGHGRDGTLGPSEALGPTWVSGRLLGALEFDGQADYVETTYYGITGTGPRTVTFWIRTTDESDHGLVSWGEVADGQKWHLRVNSDSTNGTKGAIRTEVQGGYIIGTKKISDGGWHHVASVFAQDADPDVTDVIHYVDGVLDASSGSSAQAVNTNTSSTRVNLGRRYQTSWSYFEGRLDDVRVYDRALTGTEVLALFQAASPNTPPVATDDSAETRVSIPVTITVLANDTDADGGTLVVTDATQPEFGSVRIDADGSVTYTPDPGFIGTDRFSYLVTDGQGGVGLAFVTVTVRAPAVDTGDGGCLPGAAAAGSAVVWVLFALGGAVVWVPYGARSRRCARALVRGT